MPTKLSLRLCGQKPSRYSPPGRVAQLAEQRTLNPPVAGSIPAALTKKRIPSRRYDLITRATCDSMRSRFGHAWPQPIRASTTCRCSRSSWLPRRAVRREVRPARQQWIRAGLERLLPDQDPEAFVAELRAVINDASIQIERIMSFTPAVSTTDSELYRAIETVLRRAFPEAALRGAPLKKSRTVEWSSGSPQRLRLVTCHLGQPQDARTRDVRGPRRLGRRARIKRCDHLPLGPSSRNLHRPRARPYDGLLSE